MSTDLLHFVGLAVAGSRTGCSGGERDAATLAAALLDAWPGLDASAKRGSRAFADLCGESYFAAEDLLRVTGRPA